jgi:hypothetical protein
VSGGRFFEDFAVGQVIRHATPRTVTTGDVALYTALYGSRFAVQSSDAFAKTIGYPRAPVDDLLVFHIVFGRTVALSLDATTPYLRWCLQRNGGAVASAAGHRLYLDPGDAGALLLYWMNGMREPHVAALWKKLVDAVHPDLAVDVGANYGEIVLSTKYPEDCRIVAVEANPLVSAKLERSVSEALGDSAEVHNVAASDTAPRMPLQLITRRSCQGALRYLLCRSLPKTG